jgi:hypothetical protein
LFFSGSPFFSDSSFFAEASVAFSPRP